MTKSPPKLSGEAWLETFLTDLPQFDAAAPPFNPTPSRSERKAERETRVARELTDAATEKRQTITARLKAARLESEAEARAPAAVAPLKKKVGRGKKG